MHGILFEIAKLRPWRKNRRNVANRTKERKKDLEKTGQEKTGKMEELVFFPQSLPINFEKNFINIILFFNIWYYYKVEQFFALLGCSCLCFWKTTHNVHK